MVCVSRLAYVLLGLTLIGAGCAGSDPDDPGGGAGDAAAPGDGMLAGDRLPPADGQADTGGTGADTAVTTGPDATPSGDDARTSDAPAASGDGPSVTAEGGSVDAPADASPGDAAPADAPAMPVDGAGGLRACPVFECPAGITPGTAAAVACSSDPPTITATGDYPFTAASATDLPTLSCGYALEGRRGRLFGLCLDQPALVSLTLTQAQGGGGILSVDKSCTAGGATGTCNGTAFSSPLDAGRYFVTAGAYAETAGTLGVTITRGSVPTKGFSSCPPEGACAQVLKVPAKITTPEAGGAGGAPIRAPSCSKQAGEMRALPFSLREPAQLTYTFPNCSVCAYAPAFAAIRDGCNDADLVCAVGMRGRIGVGTVALPAGSHTLIVGREGNDPLTLFPAFEGVLEPVPPPATNISCATAQPFPGGLNDRVVGGPRGKATTAPDEVTDVLRYYTIKHAGGNLRVNFFSHFAGSNMSYSFRSKCDDPGSTIQQIVNSGNWQGGNLEIRMSALPAGTYYVVASYWEGSLYASDAGPFTP